MKLKLIVAVLAIVALPLGAQAQQKDVPKPTKAAAMRVVAIITADKAKTKLYCEISKLGEQIEAAVSKKDEKKAEELSKQADDMEDKLGPEYVAMSIGLSELDPESKEGQEIEAVLSSLNKLCGN